MKKTLVTIGSTTLVLVVIWLVAYVTQPQPFEGWSEEDKLVYIHLYSSLDGGWHLPASNPNYFCDTELHILMERGAFLGIHLPAMTSAGKVPVCEYWADTAGPVPWQKDTTL